MRAIAFRRRLTSDLFLVVLFQTTDCRASDETTKEAHLATSYPSKTGNKIDRLHVESRWCIDG